MNPDEKSFAEIFCENYGVPVEVFEETILKKVLYPHARLILGPLHKWFGMQCLKADYEILADVGQACDVGGVAAVLSRLPWYYGRRWNLRRELRLRISSRRVLAIASKVGLTKARHRPFRTMPKVLVPSIGGAVPLA